MSGNMTVVPRDGAFATLSAAGRKGRAFGFFLLAAELFAPGAEAACPAHAVFLALEDRIEGFPLTAAGRTRPCQVLGPGAATQLATARALAFDRAGELHVAQFLTNSMVDIFAAAASGQTAPSRSFQLPENDLTSNAVDAPGYDFILSIRQPPTPIFVVPPGASGYIAQPIILSDPNLAQYESIAIDSHGNLLVAGYQPDGTARVDTWGTGTSLASPPLLRSLAGPNTGLPRGSLAYADNSLSIALLPMSNQLYVYNVSSNGTGARVSVFAPYANGNVRPRYAIGGLATGIDSPGIVGTRKIAVSAAGELFVARAGNRINVFAPTARNDAHPVRIIADSSSGASGFAQGGIAIR